MPLVAIDLTGRDPELIADRCWRAGATGLWEVDRSSLRAGVGDGDLERFLRELADLDPTDVTESEVVELAGLWSTVGIGGHEIALWVPGSVFGDGTHPSTRTCLDLLPTVVEVGSHVLDVGCGAGALSIGAALLGGNVTAIDVDPAAVRATADNAVRNEVAIVASTIPLADVDTTFEMVIANLTAGALGTLVPDLVHRTRPGGSLLLSGMLEDQWPGIREATGGSVDDVRVVDGWVTALVHRR